MELPLVAAMAIEIDDELAGGEHFFDVLDVVQRRLGGEALRVRQRRTLSCSGDAARCLLLRRSDCRARRAADRSTCAPRRRGYASMRFTSTSGIAARRRADDEEAARERRVGDVVVDLRCRVRRTASSRICFARSLNSGV